MNVKWRDNVKNPTEPYDGHFENLTEPYSKEIKTLQNLTQHLCQVVVTLVFVTIDEIYLEIIKLQIIAYQEHCANEHAVGDWLLIELKKFIFYIVMSTQYLDLIVMLWSLRYCSFLFVPNIKILSTFGSFA